MAIRPLNSGFGFSVGTDSIITVIDVDGNVTANVLTVDTKSYLGDVSNVNITGGSNGQYLTTDGAGNLSWQAASGNPNEIVNGNSNVSIPNSNGNIYVTANAGVAQQWIFDTEGSLITPGNSFINGLLPFNVPVDTTYKIYENQQALFGVPIEIDGQFEVDGLLIDVTTAGVVDAGIQQVLYNYNGIPTGNTGFTFNPSNGLLSLPGNVSISGNVLPSSNNVFNLGTSTQRWGNLYLSGNTIYIGNSVIDTDATTGNLNLTSGTGAVLSVGGNAQITTIQNGNTSIDVTTNGNINFTVAGISNIARFSNTSLIVNSNVNFTGASNVSLGSVGNVKITGGSNGQVLQTDGTGNLNWYSVSASRIQNGNSNITIPNVNGNVYINANAGTNEGWIFDTTGNLTGPAVSTANLGNIVSANYLVSTLGCVIIGAGEIAVDNITDNAGIFTSGIGNINIGLLANIVLGSSLGNVTVQGNLTANGNINTTNTVTAANVAVGDLYSKRAPVSVGVNTIVDQFPMATYRSAKYTIKVGDNTGYQAIEVLMVHDSINSIITVYGSLSTTGVDLVTLSSTITNGNVQLLATGLNINTSLNLMGTYVPD